MDSACTALKKLKRHSSRKYEMGAAVVSSWTRREHSFLSPNGILKLLSRKSGQNLKENKMSLALVQSTQQKDPGALLNSFRQAGKSVAYQNPDGGWTLLPDVLRTNNDPRGGIFALAAGTPKSEIVQRG